MQNKEHRSLLSTILREGGDCELKLPDFNFCKKVDRMSIAALGIKICNPRQTIGRNEVSTTCQKQSSVTLRAISYEEIAQVSRDERDSRSRVRRIRESDQWLSKLGRRTFVGYVVVSMSFDVVALPP